MFYTNCTMWDKLFYQLTLNLSHTRFKNLVSILKHNITREKLYIFLLCKH